MKYFYEIIKVKKKSYKIKIIKLLIPEKKNIKFILFLYFRTKLSLFLIVG